MIGGRGSKDDPHRMLAVFDVGGDAVERTILRLHLVAHFATDYFQTAVGAAIITGELGQELDPLIGLDLLREGNGGGLAHSATLCSFRAMAGRTGSIFCHPNNR